MSIAAWPEDVAAALGDTLFLHPAVVRALVAYWLRSYVPLPSSPPLPEQQQPQTAMSEREAGVAAIAGFVQRLVAARPCDVQLRGHLATLPTPHTTTPQPLFLWHILPPGEDWTLTVPDHYLLHATPPTVACALAGAMGTMTSAPDTYWARVMGGGVRGPLMADTFRYGDALRRAYMPDYMVAHTYAALLEALVHRELTSSGVAIHGAQAVRALAQPLLEPAASQSGSAVLQSLAERLSECTDPDAVLRDVRQLVANLDTLAMREYTRRRTESPLSEGAVYA
jgi:hypothetical protein